MIKIHEKHPWITNEKWMGIFEKSPQDTAENGPIHFNFCREVSYIEADQPPKVQEWVELCTKIRSRKEANRIRQEILDYVKANPDEVHGKAKSIELLKESEEAFNYIRNQKVNNVNFTDTYDLVSAIGKHLKDQ